MRGLVASVVPCVSCVVVRPSTDMKNNCQRPVRFGLEREMTSVGRPGRALIVALAARELVRARAAGADRPEVVRSRPLRVDDGIALRRPARLRVKAARGELAYVAAVLVHDEDARLSRAVGDERHLLAARRPGRLGVDPRVSRETLQHAGRQREHVDLRVAVLRERERQVAPVGAPAGRGVDAHERGEASARAAAARRERGGRGRDSRS